MIFMGKNSTQRKNNKTMVPPQIILPDNDHKHPKNLCRSNLYRGNIFKYAPNFIPIASNFPATSLSSMP